MITRMYADIMFDREINTSMHYIVPGGYAIRTMEDEVVNFDFFDYYASVDVTNSKILHVETRNLDCDEFPDAIMLEDYLGHIKEMEEFFVYTGEVDDPEIISVKLIGVDFIKDDGTQVSLTKKQLAHVNKEWGDIYEEISGKS